VNQREPGDDPEAMVPGQITSGHIGLADYDTYTFTATSNDVGFVALHSTGGGRYPYLHLYDSQGTVVATHYDATSYAVLRNIQLPKTDTYTLAITEDGFDYEWDYTLCMIKIPGSNSPDPGDGPSDIVPFENAAAQITPGDLDAFAFAAIAGDTITLQLQEVSGSGTRRLLDLFAPDGTLLDSSSARVTSHCVSQTGIYVAVVADEGFDESFGYILSLSQTPVVPLSSGATQYLAIYLCMTNVVLRWETNAVGFRLESRIPPGTSWFAVDRAPEIIAHHYYVDEGVVTNKSQFYRLRCTTVPSRLARGPRS